LEALTCGFVGALGSVEFHHIVDGMSRDIVDTLREGLPPDGVEADEEAAAWLGQWSLQLGQLSRPVLATVDQALGVGDDRAPLGPATAGRFRKVSRACIRRAFRLDVC
jgi:hypothetical protein